MPKTITQKVVFKNTTPETLYDLYMDAKEHAASTGAPVKITKKEGASYSVHDGYITGINLHLVPGKMIVQTWRGNDWKKSDPDSIFTLLFEKDAKDAILYMTHANLPADQEEGIQSGWKEFYWKPWKTYLAKK